MVYSIFANGILYQLFQVDLLRRSQSKSYTFYLEPLSQNPGNLAASGISILWYMVSVSYSWSRINRAHPVLANLLLCFLHLCTARERRQIVGLHADY